MATIANMLARCNEFQARIGKYSIKKIDVFPLLRDIINKLREATGQELEEVLPKPFQVLVAKDIEAGIAKTYPLILKTREPVIIDSLVIWCNEGSLPGCSLNIDETQVEFEEASVFDVSDVPLTELSATGNNAAGAGATVFLNITEEFTGEPTEIYVQLNYTKAIVA